MKTLAVIVALILCGVGLANVNAAAIVDPTSPLDVIRLPRWGCPAHMQPVGVVIALDPQFVSAEVTVTYYATGDGLGTAVPCAPESATL